MCVHVCVYMHIYVCVRMCVSVCVYVRVFGYVYVKRSFFLVAVLSILLYGCTTRTLTKRLEKKLDGNYTRMLQAILNKSWRQHPTRHQLYGHLPPITKTIQVRRTRHAGHRWRSRDELISDVLLWTPTYGRAKAGRTARTYIQQLCEDTGCSPEDLPEAMNDREKWRERVKNIRASGTTWWWCICRCVCVYIYIYIYIYICVCVCVYLYIYVYVNVCECVCMNVYIYIYIYCHPQTDCFVLSELFSVARHVERSKPRSKPIQLYVRLSFRPLGEQVHHVG